MTIYISGKITGMKPEEYNPLFEAAEQDLIAAGIQKENIVNPTKLGIPQNGSWSDAMAVCLKALSKCTAIYMLRNWPDSLGARHELTQAGMARMDIYFESNDDIRHLSQYVSAGIL